MPLNDDFLSDAVAHQVDLIAYANAIERDLSRRLDEEDAALIALIIALLGRAGVTQEGNILTPSQRRKVNEALREIRDRSRRAMTLADGVVGRAIDDLAEQEAETEHMALDGLAAPVIATVWALRSVPSVRLQPASGRTRLEWAASVSAARWSGIRSAIRRGVVEGNSIGAIGSAVRASLRRSRRDIGTVLRTLVTHASVQIKEALYRVNPWVNRVIWVSVLDSRTTAICRARSGSIYPVGVGPRPPAHARCLPGDCFVAPGGAIAAGMKRRYEGDLVILKTAGGLVLPCTPNHPILTGGGWVAASALDAGVEVICDGRGVGSAATVEAEHDNSPSTIQEVVDATLLEGSSGRYEVPTSREDFHGDGVDGEVCVVATNGGLPLQGEPPGLHIGENHVFQGGCVEAALLARLGDFLAVLLAVDRAARRSVGGSGEVFDFGLAGAFHASELLFGAIPELDAAFSEDPLDGARGASERFGYALDPDPAGVFSDHITRVDVSSFCGHVYNLQTESGWYSANGIVTHNCRSTISPLARGQALPSMPTYDEWLRRQSAAVQNRVLGPTRARAYRKDSSLTMKSFVNRSGNLLTLKELRRRRLGFDL